MNKERFLGWPMAAGLALFGMLALTFDNGRVSTDGEYYFAFLRRLFGVDTPAQAYQYGSAFWNAPFYLVSQLVASRGDLSRYHAGEIGVTAAANASVLVTLYVAWRILRELELPRGPAVLLLTLFGTPLFFYAVMEPSYKHAADTLYITAAVWFLLRVTQEPGRRVALAAGAFLGFALVTRYANAGFIAGALLTLALIHERRRAAWVLAGTAVTAVILLLVPIARGIPFNRPANLPFSTTLSVGGDGPFAQAAGTRLALGTSIIPGTQAASNVKLDLLAPYKMLFTLHRGLFIWTPLTALATFGFVLLVRRERRHRAFLLVLAGGALGLLEMHVLWGRDWDGGGSFSNRLLTALFPLYVLGVAELVRRRRRIALAALSLCAAFALFVALVQTVGYGGQSAGDGIGAPVAYYSGAPGHASPGYFFGTKVWQLVQDRWKLFWNLPS